MTVFRMQFESQSRPILFYEDKNAPLCVYNDALLLMIGTITKMVELAIDEYQSVESLF